MIGTRCIVPIAESVVSLRSRLVDERRHVECTFARVLICSLMIASSTLTLSCTFADRNCQVPAGGVSLQRGRFLSCSTPTDERRWILLLLRLEGLNNRGCKHTRSVSDCLCRYNMTVWLIMSGAATICARTQYSTYLLVL